MPCLDPIVNVVKVLGNWSFALTNCYAIPIRRNTMPQPDSRAAAIIADIKRTKNIDSAPRCWQVNQELTEKAECRPVNQLA